MQTLCAHVSVPRVRAGRLRRRRGARQQGAGPHVGGGGVGSRGGCGWPPGAGRRAGALRWASRAAPPLTRDDGALFWRANSLKAFAGLAVRADSLASPQRSPRVVPGPARPAGLVGAEPLPLPALAGGRCSGCVWRVGRAATLTWCTANRLLCPFLYFPPICIAGAAAQRQGRDPAGHHGGGPGATAAARASARGRRARGCARGP